MAKIEGFREVLKDVTLGRLWHQRKKRPLTPMTVVIGKHGLGKVSCSMPLGSLLTLLNPALRKLAMREEASALKKYGRKVRRAPSDSMYITGNIGMHGPLHISLT